MLGYNSFSRMPKTVLVLLGSLAACSPRTLTLVNLYSDGALPSLDGNPGDVSDAIAWDGGRTPSSIDGNPSEASDGSSPATLWRGLVGLWHFDDGLGSLVAIDSSGNGNDGTLVGLDPPAQPWVDGHLGGALATNGVGYAMAADSPSIDGITARVTLSAWVYFDGVIPVDYVTALSRQMGTTTGQYYHLSLYLGGIPTFFIGLKEGVPEARAQGPQPIDSRRWTHLAGTYDGSRAILYVDGAEVGSWPISGVFAADTTPVILGGNGNEAEVTERFPGSIDEVALFNRALSRDEIRLLATGAVF